jgi:arginyl-tRNA synthetase
MNLYAYFHTEIVRIVEALIADGRLPAGLDAGRATVEPPRDASHGDLSTNVAMVLGKTAGLPPRAFAELLVEPLGQHPAVTEVSVAGPGFINWRVGDGFWHERLGEVLLAGVAYGDSTMGAGQPVNVEYVSANPTGPMHVGHARGAVFGDALAGLLDKAGYAVTREYYINDAGAQVDVLARSTHRRYREALGEAIGAMPEGLYPGDYLAAAGVALAARDGSRWQGRPEAEWLPTIRRFAVDAMMELIRADLARLGVKHDVFVSERGLHEGGAIEAALRTLDEAGLIYTGTLEPPKGKAPPEDWEPRPQTLFRSTEFGDDVDRPLKKSDGSWTYFAADIAYHLDKVRRGYANLIDVLGADHGGYVKRMQAAVKAISGGKAALDVKLCQLVNLTENGQPVRMSKRAGTFVTLSDVVEQVGKDIVRFIMLTRKNDQALDFDFAKVTEQSKDNMVWYVQYAHARAQSVLRHARGDLADPALAPADLAAADKRPLTDPAELALIRLLASWPRLVESAAEAHEPHRVVFYLYDVAAAFHGLWNKGKDDANLRFIIAGEAVPTKARLALVQAVALVIASGMVVLGVEPAMEMR